MKLKLINTLTLGLTALCFVQNPIKVLADEKGTPGQLSAKDYKFVYMAAKGGMMEVDLGKVAAEKGMSPKVKEIGQRMVQDHQKANMELTQLAAQKGATLPDSNDMKATKMRDHLNNLSSADFDKAYLQQMVRDHKMDIKEFKSEAANGDDADLKAWAAKMLPTLEQHLAMIKMAQKSSGYASDDSMGNGMNNGMSNNMGNGMNDGMSNNMNNGMNGMTNSNNSMTSTNDNSMTTGGMTNTSNGNSKNNADTQNSMDNK